MTESILKPFLESVKITAFVLVMMILVDLLNVWTQGKLSALLQKGRRWKQYIVASFLGATPGCFGAFAGVSLYVHGMLNFGALTGMMVATAGDAQFIMLAMFPETALLIFGLLFVVGIFAGVITDFIVKKYNITLCTDCEAIQFHKNESGLLHYFKEHIWKHIIKKHIWKTFLWVFGALLVLEFGLKFWNIEAITSEYVLLLLLVSAVIGLIPESGPHIIFVTMFAQGLIPFSVLLTSSIVQDGHGMLPLLSYSVNDSIKVKVFNLGFGVIIGLLFYMLGY